MTDTVLRFLRPAPQNASSKLIPGWNALRPAARPGLFSRLENAFAAWQAARLRQLSPERLWAPAMQDARSFAEIRRARRTGQD